MLSTSTTVVEASCLLPQKRLIEEVAEEEEDYFGENDGMVDENIRCAEENDGCTDAVILMSDGESEEEEEWNFPSVDDAVRSSSSAMTTPEVLLENSWPTSNSRMTWEKMSL